MTTRDAVRAALSWLATYGLHSTLFLGAAWLLCVLRPPRVNRNRERLWKLALVGGVVSATLQVAIGARPLLGRIDWPLADPERAAPATARPSTPVRELPREQSEPAPQVAQLSSRIEPLERTSSASLPAAHGPAMPEDTERVPMSAPPNEAGEPAQLAGPAASTTSGASATTRPAPQHVPTRAGFLARLSSPSWSQRWPGFVLGLWFACGLLGLAGLLFSWSCLRRRMLGRRILTEGALVELLDDLRARAGIARRVRLSVSPRIAAPFSTGLFRAEVCVPAAVLTALTRTQQEALLAHELAHLLRRDPAWFGLGYLLEKLFFFQPLNRLARRRISELAEIACDDWAVRWTGARTALASCLAEVAGWVVGERPRLVMPPGLAGHPSRLRQRVERLLDDRRSPAGEPPTSWWPPLAAATLALAALAVPGVSAETTRRPRPTGAEPRPDEPPTIRPPALTSPEPDPLPEPEVPASFDLSAARGVLETELALLEGELSALHAELEARALDMRFQEALQKIDGRMEELRAQHQRARELLALLTDPHTPASTPDPLADALPPSTNPGESR